MTQTPNNSLLYNVSMEILPQTLGEMSQFVIIVLFIKTMSREENNFVYLNCAYQKSYTLLSVWIGTASMITIA